LTDFVESAIFSPFSGNFDYPITAMMQSETIRQRASILGVQVISKATATRLGIVTQIWLDVDQRKVMGLSVAERFIPGTAIGIGDTSYMSIDRIFLLGPDAILVEDESVLEDILVTEKYTNLIGNEVVTESGELLGKVRDFKFDPETGDLVYLILAALGSPLIPASVISTYELDVNEIIAVGRDRIIVTEGMEDRMTQLSKGLLERLGLGKPPWEDEFEDEYNMPPATYNNLRDNALSSGKRSNNSYSDQRPEQRPIYRREEVWEEDDDNWSEERVPISPAPRRQARPEPRSESRPEPKPARPIAPPPVDDDYDDYDDYEDGYPKAKGYREETRQQIKEAWGSESKIPDKSKMPIPEEEYDDL
jgi:sporulation protein YlmC with PRC-barrel domain